MPPSPTRESALAAVLARRVQHREKRIVLRAGVAIFASVLLVFAIPLFVVLPEVGLPVLLWSLSLLALEFDWAKRRPSADRRPGRNQLRLTSTDGLLDNRNIGVIGVEDVHDIPPCPGEYLAQLIRRHHRVVHPRANDVTKTYAYPDLTR